MAVAGTVTFEREATLTGLSAPLGIALNPAETKLCAAGNGKVDGGYGVTIDDLDLTGRPAATAAHLGGDETGLCNPATVGVDPSGLHLYVVNRGSPGGSIAVYNLNADGSPRVPAGASPPTSTSSLRQWCCTMSRLL